MNYTTAQASVTGPYPAHNGQFDFSPDAPSPSPLIDTVRALKESLEPQHRLISDLQDVLSPVRRQNEDINNTAMPAVPLPAPLAELRNTPAGEELTSLFHHLTDVTNRLISLRASLAV